MIGQSRAPRPSSFSSYLRSLIAASGAYGPIRPFIVKRFFSNRYSCYSFCPILIETFRTCRPICLFVCFLVRFFYFLFFLQGGQQCWALWAFLAACPCTLFIDIISLCLLIGQIKMLACLLYNIYRKVCMGILCPRKLFCKIFWRFLKVRKYLPSSSDSV